MTLIHSGRLSPRQLAAARRKTEAEIRRDARARAKRMIRELRERIRAVRKSRSGRAAELRELCRTSRRELREAQRAERLALREQQRADRTRQSAGCRARRKALPLAIAAEVGELTRELERVQEGQHEAAAAHRVGQRMERDTRSRAERRQEEEDRARRELPAELLPVFEAQKAKLRSTDRASLAEVFLQWAHDHSAQVAEILYADEIAHLAALERDERALSREYRRWQKRGGKLSAALRDRLEATGELAAATTAPRDFNDEEPSF